MGGGGLAIPLGVYAHQPQFLPAPLHHVLDAEIEFTAHDDCVGFPSQLVQEIQGDGIDLVVDVETGSQSRSADL